MILITKESRLLIETFSSSGYFIVNYEPKPEDTLDDVESERARAALIIPPQFAKNLGRGETSVQILLDGADNSSVGPISGYMNGIQSKAVARLTDFDQALPYTLKSRFLFNPELNSQWFIIPGLIAIIMSVLSILLTSLTIAREWENGSMELLLSTPVKPIEIVFGKLFPYAVRDNCITHDICSCNFFISCSFQREPNYIWNRIYHIFNLIFAQGLLISILTKNQQIALQFASLTGFLPSQLLSGFIFPIASMPIFFTYFTMIFPARWFVQISRNLFLKYNVFHLTVTIWNAHTDLYCDCLYFYFSI